jgi:hypothetical protein
LPLDVSGGYSTSILNAIRSALQTSTHILFEKERGSNYVPLSYHEAFYLATLGGAKGRQCEALLICKTKIFMKNGVFGGVTPCGSGKN